MRALVHPRMLARVTPAFLTSMCSIETYTPTTTANGEVVPAWIADAGRSNIPCIVATTTGIESREGLFIAEVLSYRITLAGKWDINAADRVVVDGLRYELLGVIVDTHEPTTTLVARRVI